MKTYILFITLLLSLILNVKCSPDINLNSNNGESVTIKVKEYKTDLPVSQAVFNTYYCKIYDFEFGDCDETKLFSSCTTNNDGICTCSFPENNGAGISIMKTNYWSYVYPEGVNPHEYSIQPQAWVTINFTTDENYPATSYIFITITGELKHYSTSIKAVNNASLVLTLYGDEENRINWSVYETSNISSQLLNSGSFILHPKKFENSIYTLAY